MRETELTDLELAVAIAGVAAFHVVDHRVVPERFHAATHPLAGVAAIALGRLAGLSWDELGLAPRSLADGARVGALHSAGAMAVVGLGPLWPRLAPLLEDPRLEEAAEASLARTALVEIPLGTALYEELVFRGVLHALLTRRFGVLPGAIAGSVLFGLWHVLPALEDRKHNPVAGRHGAAATVGPTVIGTTLAGAWFTWLRSRSGSVLAPMMVHATTNSVGLVSATLITRRRHRRDQPPPVPPRPADQSPAAQSPVGA